MERSHRDPYIEPGQLTLSIGEKENRTTLNDAVPPTPSKKDADVLRLRCYFTINVQRWEEWRWPPCLMGIIYPTIKKKENKKQQPERGHCLRECVFSLILT